MLCRERSNEHERKGFFMRGGGDGEEQQDYKPSRVESSEVANRAKIKIVMSRLI